MNINIITFDSVPQHYITKEVSEMKAYTAKNINFIRGRNSVGAATQYDVDQLLEHIDALESFLDEYECEDVFGTEGKLKP